MLVFAENRSTRRKTSRSREENQQQTQPTYDVECGNRTRATLVEGECSHHCDIPATQRLHSSLPFLRLQVYLRHLPTALATLVTLATLSTLATLITFATFATIHLLRLLQYIFYTCCPMSLLHLLATLFALAMLATLATLFEVATLHSTGGINRQP